MMTSEQIDELIGRMTLDEKASMLAGADFWRTVPVPRLGIPAIKVTDGPVGARGSQHSGGPTSACFPCGTALAATWNPELVGRVGAALAEEVKAKGCHVLLAPTVNIHRSPLAGRNFECYSEDPHLTGRMAVAYIGGLQSQGVGACVKHYVCNDSEFERHSMSSEVGERALREIYLPPFRAAVREARTWAVMSAYNKVNGTWCSENLRLLVEILKGEWGFDGAVISDWFGTYTPAPAANGLDLEMPGPARWMGGVADAVREGTLGEAVVDEHVRRLLRLIDRVGAFEHPQEEPERAVDRPEHRRLARQAAAEAIVLLKNEAGLLPIDPVRVRSIAVIGDNARRAAVLGGGSTTVFPHYVVAPLDAIRERAGDGVDVGYAVGCPLHVRLPVVNARWLTADDGAPAGLTAAFYNSPDLSGPVAHTRLVERLGLNWFDNCPPGVDSDLFSLRLSGTLRVPESGRYTFGLLSGGPARLLLDGAAAIDAWHPDRPEWPPFDPGQPEHSAEAVLEGGRAYRLVVEYSTVGVVLARFLQVGALRSLPDDPIAEAAALAARSDVAVVVAGLTAEWESEGFDRANMELPRDQARLIEAVAAANPRTVVVLNAGSPVAMRWLDRVPAVLQAWYGGQEAGHALADVLFGDACPSGRLPTTFPCRLEDNPAYLNYPGENGQVLYGEGLFVGYRYYDKKDVAPLFPFGHGLSYTTFAYRSLTLSAERYSAGETIEVRVEVENTGTVAGQEVVQLYVRDLESSLVRPVKELKAFAKVALEPGERKAVVLALGPEALSFYDPAGGEWVAEPGEFEVIAAASARDARLSARFVLE